MGTKTTLMLDPALYKAAKRVAVDRDSTLSEILNKGLLLYVSDPEGVEEMAEILTDRKAMRALLEGIEARARGRKGYYLDWKKVRAL
ncbi:MAG: hypothetical protein ACE5HK_03895 [Candidatus Methylomirabilales bacterium]